MDPITASTTFATLVGLIATFRQERGKQEALDHRAFVDWLTYHKLEDLKNYISNTADIQSEIDVLLKQDMELVISKLDSLSSLIAGVATRIEGVSGLARVLKIESEISEQAFGILKLIVESGAKSLMTIRMREGLHLQLDVGGSIQYDEPRFIDDDLDRLVEFDLLTHHVSPNGTHSYRITRKAVAYIEASQKEEK